MILSIKPIRLGFMFHTHAQTKEAADSFITHYYCKVSRNTPTATSNFSLGWQIICKIFTRCSWSFFLVYSRLHKNKRPGLYTLTINILPSCARIYNLSMSTELVNPWILQFEVDKNVFYLFRSLIKFSPTVYLKMHQYFPRLKDPSQKQYI